MRRHLLPVSLLLTLVSATALTGCSGNSSSGSPKPSSSASSSPSPTPTPSVSPSSGSASPSPTSPSASPSSSVSAPPTPPASLPHDRLAAASYHNAYLERNAASTPEEQAVVNVWMAYWQSVMTTLFNTKPVAHLDEYAAGQARRSVLDYLQSQDRKNRRAVGWTKDNVLSVRITGDTAKVHDCTMNFTFSVDEEGEPATRVVPWYDVTGTLQKRQGSWVVTQQTTTSQKQSCLP